MIASQLSIVAEQIPATPNLQIAFDFLKRKGWEGLPEGRFEVDGAAVWGLIQTYETQPTPVYEFETHRHHIDIHYIVTGEETFYWIPADHLKPNGVYDEPRDVWITTVAVGAEQVTALKLRAGEVAVFFPSDGHWPRRASSTPVQVKRILIKIDLNI